MLLKARVNENNKISMIARKLRFIFKDKIGIIVILSVFFQSVIFMNVIKNSGAAKLKFDLNGFLYGNTRTVLLFAIIFVSFSFLFSKKIHLIFLVLTNTIYSIMLVADLWYYRGFQDFLSLHSFGETQNLHNLSKAVLAMARPIDLIFILDSIAIILLAIFFRRHYYFMNREKGIFTFFFICPFIILILLHCKYDFNGENYNGPILFKTQYIPYATMENLSPIGYHFYDTVMYVKDNMPVKLSSKDEDSIKEWLDYKNENLPDNEYKALFQGKNLIFIQVESLENFVINQQYNGQVLTPNLNNLIKNSFYFSNFYEQVNNGNSGDADLMSNASVLPVRRGSTFFRFPNNQYTTIADLLKNNDYYTRSLHASDGAIWNVSQALKKFGFDESKDEYDFDTSKTFWMGLTDEDFFNQVSNLMDADKKPFYYYTVTVTSHEPFELPDDMKSLNLQQDFDETSMGKYFQAIHYTDAQIGNFIKKLDDKGILDNTVVVIYGDHSGVHKYFNDEIKSLDQYESWWDNNYKVPFIIYNKNLTGKNIDTIGAQIDILPTISYLMGIDKTKYENTSMGRNLLNTKKSYAILNDGTIVGKENLAAEDIEHVKKSFDIADLITRTDYFKSDN